MIHRRKGFLLVGWLALLFSCQSENFLTIGGNFIHSDAHVVCTDTITVRMSTFKLDSLQTSNKSIALVGSYNDVLIGNVSSRSYIVLGISTNYIDETAIYDSLVMHLTPSGYYYGDTLAPYQISVHRVTQDIDYAEGASALYNTSHFRFGDQPLGKGVFYPRPGEKKEMRIPLDDQLGHDLVQLMTTSKNPFEVYGGFTSYFKGIVLNYSESNNLVLGFNSNDTSVVIKLWYHLADSDDALSVSLTPTSSQYQFNQIASTSNASLLRKLTSKALVSDSLGNNAFVQGGTGIFTRIDFPSLRNLFLPDRGYEVLKAQLVIQPASEMDPNYLPSSLYLIATNKHNDFLASVTDASGNKLTGSLVKDDIYHENSTYSWDVTSVVKTILNVDQLEYNGLILFPENYDTKFDHVVVADPFKSRYKTHLKLYLLYYE